MIPRRDFLLAASSATCLASSPAVHGEESTPAAKNAPLRVALNTSTIRGQKLDIVQQIQVTADAGFDGIEPWIRDLRKYVDEGGNPAELKSRLQDLNLEVVSAIGFANWIADDEETRANGLEEAKRDMELVRQIGGRHIAAPPIGAHRKGSVAPALPVIAQRYRDLCNVGQAIGVYPQLELWGFSPTLSKLPELAYVASAAAHPMACVLPDFYHIYKGGNDFESLRMIEASAMHCFHINDYPADPPLTNIADKDRVFPGDGVCELTKIIGQLIANGFDGVFSLELFNPTYWKRDAADVAKEGLLKSRSVIAAAIS